MCGFTGILEGRLQNASKVTFELLLEKMGKTLNHRGPDGNEIWSDREAGIGLSHRRLAILDLSPTGSQPMKSASGRYVMVYNGEIYNFAKVRSMLEKEGTLFKGTSDSEVLIESISSWGITKSLAQFNGMFAFAIWDRKEQELIFARDRIGKKPLYYGWAGNSFVFASELKAICKHPDFERKIDREALTLFLRYNYVPAPFSIFKGIYKLFPGSILKITREDVIKRTDVGELSVRQKCYWTASDIADPELNAPFKGTEKEAADQLEALLLDATDCRMISDVPIGALLSGGVDSSTIVSLMQAKSSSPVKTFTVGFARGEKDEARHAKKIANFLGTDHTEIYLTGQDALNVVPDLPRIYDEPFADSSQIPTFLVSRLARGKVTVALSGDGGDELFCGYRRYLRGARIWQASNILPKILRLSIANIIEAVAGGAIESNLIKFAQDFKGEDALAMYQNRLSNWRLPGAGVISGKEPPASFFEITRETKIEEVIHLMMFTDLISYLPDDILVKVDRASMAVGLELRNPILDYRVVEFAWTLPLSMKVKGNKGKVILRRVMGRYLPTDLTDRPKQGFGSPMRSWLSGPLRGWAEDLLAEERLLREGYFHPKVIRNIWNRFISGKHKLHPRLWNVLMFQAWNDRYISPFRLLRND